MRPRNIIDLAREEAGSWAIALERQKLAVATKQLDCGKMVSLEGGGRNEATRLKDDVGRGSQSSNSPPGAMLGPRQESIQTRT